MDIGMWWMWQITATGWSSSVVLWQVAVLIVADWSIDWLVGVIMWKVVSRSLTLLQGSTAAIWSLQPPGLLLHAAVTRRCRDTTARVRGQSSTMLILLRFWSRSLMLNKTFFLLVLCFSIQICVSAAKVTRKIFPPISKWLFPIHVSLGANMRVLGDLWCSGSVLTWRLCNDCFPWFIIIVQTSSLTRINKTETVEQWLRCSCYFNNNVLFKVKQKM